MSFGQATPESLLLRSDSKNPATTCKGITSNGRPCRRGLAQSPHSSPMTSPSRNNGVLAVLDCSDSKGGNAAAFYCYQHKDQAESLAATGRKKTTLLPLKEKTSIDTLVERVGVMNLDDESGRDTKRHHRRKRQDERPSKKRDTLPSGWRNVDGPLTTVPEVIVQPQWKLNRQRRHGRSNVKASFLCCVRAIDDDMPPSRKREDRRRSQLPAPGVAGTQQHAGQSDRLHVDQLPQAMSHVPTTSTKVQRKAIASRTGVPSSIDRVHPRLVPPSPNFVQPLQTLSLLSLIPPHLSPITTSLLLAELSKPISSHDDEGYIYVFWLTPESLHSQPDDETASSLLDPPDQDTASADNTPPRRERELRRDESLKRYASTRRATNPTQPARTILLKIGRAANVHRRLSQWTKQCGQNITLIRYYPYHSSSTPPTSSPAPRKAPHIHRIERLIHIELTEKRVTDQGPCENCGIEHREWFEIAATRKGLKEVDECVRRWVTWGGGGACCSNFMT